MGGRGSSSGISDSGKEYGTEYETLISFGNIKFIRRTSDNTSAPLETKTKGRVYVTINQDGKPKFVSYYDTENKRSKTIDIDALHKGIKTHVHHGYHHNEKDGPKGATKLTPKEKKMVERINKLWYNSKSK